MYIMNKRKSKRNAISEVFGWMLISAATTAILGYAAAVSYTDIGTTFGQAHTFFDIATKKNSEILTFQDTTVSPTEVRIEVMNIGKAAIVIDKVSTPSNSDAPFTVETLQGTPVSQIDPNLSHVVIIPDITSPPGVMIISENTNLWLVALQ